MGTIYQVVEIFGPTVQGEGRYIGTPCYFLRLGGCDYRCTWCDSMHAVDRKYEEEWAEMTSVQILEALRNLPGNHPHLIVSGGNPAIQPLDPLLEVLRADVTRQWEVAIETQGTIIAPWLSRVDHVTVSPKPPSSGMRQSKIVVAKFARSLIDWLPQWVTVDCKVVVFDATDMAWAREMMHDVSWPVRTRFFLSVGTRSDDTTVTLLQRYREVIGGGLEMFSDGPVVSILPQMHVLLWGHKKGV